MAKIPSVMQILVLAAALIGLLARSAPAQPTQDSGAAINRAAIKNTAEQQAQRYAQHWQQAISTLTQDKSFGWIAVVFLFAFGSLSMLFGWALVKSAFLPIAAMVGCGTGALGGMQIALIVSPLGGEGVGVRPMIWGGTIGFIALLGAAIKVRPLAWMLVVAAPFFVASVVVFPMEPWGELLAMISVAGGMLLALLAAIKQRLVAAASSGLLGALCLAFCWGALARLTNVHFLNASFNAAIAHPLALMAGILVVAIAAADLQCVLGPTDIVIRTDRAGQ